MKSFLGLRPAARDLPQATLERPMRGRSGRSEPELNLELAMGRKVHATEPRAATEEVNNPP